MNDNKADFIDQMISSPEAGQTDAPEADIEALRAQNEHLSLMLKAWDAQIFEASRQIKKQREQIARLRTALKPFGYYYELNDCHERKADDTLEVPIEDLRKAFELVGGHHPNAR